MLAYPFTFYAVNGINAISKRCGWGNANSILCLPNKKVGGMILLTLSLGSAYLFTPVLMPHTGTSIVVFPTTSVYFSTPKFPYEDVDRVVQAMQWLNANMRQDSCVIMHQVFRFWGELYLDKAHVIVHFEVDVDSAVKVAFDHVFSHIYFVWWNENVEWYGIMVPSHFIRLSDFGRMSNTWNIKPTPIN